MTKAGFGFKSGICLLIAPVPVRCFSLAFIEYKHLVRQVSDRAYEKYLGDILGLNNDQEDQNGGEPPKVKTKKLYSLLKHSKQDSSGIAH